MRRQTSSPEVEPVRIFQRLQQTLGVLITATPTGGKLPSEPDLARQMGVSRATLREAMRSFEGQGLIRRRQGIGTFVVRQSQVLDSGLEVLESIETMAGKIKLDVSMGDLSIEPFTASASIAQAMDVEEGTNLVRVSRVILAENRPVAYLVDILPMDVLSPEDLKVGFTGSVLDFLLSQGSLQLVQSMTEIRAMGATSEIAHALEIQRGDVLLAFTAHLFTAESRMVAYSTSHFLPGYFRFHVLRRVENDLPLNH